MYRFFSSIAGRKRFFIPLLAVCLCMFGLMQALFALQFADAAVPDSLFSYGPARLVAMLDALGPAGRSAYLRIDLADMVFPLAYGLFFATLIVFFWGVRGGAKGAATVLAFIPLLGAAADFAENICVRSLIALFARGENAAFIRGLSHPALWVAGIATTAKWSSMAAALAAICIGSVFSALRRKKSGALSKPHTAGFPRS